MILGKFDHDRTLFSRTLESWLGFGKSSPFMALKIRLVKYYNLPRFDPSFFQTNPYEQCSEPLLVDIEDYHDIHHDHNALWNL